jgi:hypothetical protein
MTATPLFLLTENTEKKNENRTTKRAITRKKALPLTLAQLKMKKLA